MSKREIEFNASIVVDQKTIGEDIAAPDTFDPPRNGWDDVADIREAKRICREMAGTILKGKAGEKDIFDLAYRVRQYAISEAVAAVIIKEYSEAPFDLHEVRKIVDHAYRVSVNPPGLASVARGRRVGGVADGWDEEFEDDEFETPAPKGPRAIDYDTNQNNAKIFEVFSERRGRPIISSDGELYSWEGKVWSKISETALAAEIRATDPTYKLDTNRVLQIAKGAHVECRVEARPFEWIDMPRNAPEPNDLVLFANGILDVATMTLLPHTQGYFATSLPEMDFDPDAVCPTWERCLNEWLDDSYHATLEEFFGYSMTVDNSQHKMLALLGVPRGGKSTALGILNELVGIQHIAARTFSDLGGEFGLEGTLDKKVIVIGDATDAHASRRGVVIDRIKSITGNDPVSINRKNLQIVSARLPCRIVLVANRHPKLLDDSGALAAREIVVLFERTFLGKEDRELPDKLRAELSGIANRCLAALQRLRKSRRFSVGTKGVAASRALAESQSPALRFANAELHVTGDLADYAALQPVFERYEDWAREESLGAGEWRNRNDFKDDLIAALRAKGVRFERRRWRDPNASKHGKAARVWGFFGIRLKPDKRLRA